MIEKLRPAGTSCASRVSVSDTTTLTAAPLVDLCYSSNAGISNIGAVFGGCYFGFFSLYLNTTVRFTAWPSDFTMTSQFRKLRKVNSYIGHSGLVNKN